MTSSANSARSAALHRIPSLDGIRALSIVMVLGLHTIQRLSLTRHIPLAWSAVFNGGLGVFIFFVISGYLITRLLLHEFDTRDTISLRGFYLKRAFRILPPLWVYLAVLVVLHLAGRLPFPRHGVLAAFLFLQNYWLAPTTWAVEHFWSLSVEEQFYLLWPPVLILCLRAGRARGRHLASLVAVGVILVSPAIRVLSFQTHVPLIHHNAGIHMHADALMFGCAAALLEGRRRFEQLYRALTRWPALPFLALALGSWLDVRFQNYWNFPIGETYAGLLVAACMLWCIRNAAGATGRLLNSTLLVHLGVLSYSAYIWQTLLLHPANTQILPAALQFGAPVTNLVCVFVLAQASYSLVERPSLTLRNRVLRSTALYRRDPAPASSSLGATAQQV